MSGVFDLESRALPRPPRSRGVGIPVGGTLAYAGGTVPSGFLFCDGAAVSRSDYAALFAAIGTAWGAGDGSTTFNLPDLRGRAPIGVGTGVSLTSRLLGDKVGDETHTLAESEMPSHNHSATYGYGGSDVNGGRISIEGVGGAGAVTGSSTAIGAKGGGGAHNNMQPSVALNFIICAAAG